MLTRQEMAQRVAEKLGLKINEDGSWYQYHPAEAIPDNVRDHLLDLEEEVDKAARRIKVMEQDHAAEVAGLRSELEDKKS